MHERLAEADRALRRLPPALIDQERANVLRRLLPQARDADEMRCLFEAIQAHAGLLRNHPKLVDALSAYGPVAAREVPWLLEQIVDACLGAAQGRQEPEAVWLALFAHAPFLPVSTLRSFIGWMESRVAQMPTNCLRQFGHLFTVLAMRSCAPYVQTQAPRLDDELQRITAQAAALPAQAALVFTAEEIVFLLDRDRVRSPEQWRALTACLTPALLNADPSLRLQLARQLLASPALPTPVFAQAAARILQADTGGAANLLSVWKLFCGAIQEARLPHAGADQLFRRLEEAPVRPPKADGLLDRARVALERQRKALV